MNKDFSLWLASLPRLVKISLLMESPAALPYRPAPLLLTLVSYILIGYFALGSKYTLLSIIAQILIEVAILGGISYFFLRIKHKLRRLLQTLYALIGVNLIISLLSLLVFQGVAGGGGIEPGSWLLTAQLLVLLWNLAAVSLIFQRAFEISTLLAAFCAFNYLLLYEFILLNIF